jgi:hypothetical protein
VSADDLCRAPATDALRAAVPAGDVAVRVECEDAVVADAVDQQPEPLLALAHHLLGPAPLAEVASDLGEADEFPLRVAKRRDDDVGPELRSVLPNAPALILHRALSLGNLQLALRLPALLILRRIEDREVLADDLLRRITLEPLGARVPRDDVAGGIEREDGVIVDRLDQQPIEVGPERQTVFGPGLRCGRANG